MKKKYNIPFFTRLLVDYCGYIPNNPVVREYLNDCYNKIAGEQDSKVGGGIWERVM